MLYGRDAGPVSMSVQDYSTGYEGFEDGVSQETAVM